MEFKVKLYEFDINGIKVLAQDLYTSGTLEVVKDDLLTNAYGLNDISDPGSGVIIDLGAHVGLVTCYLAKKYPDAKIIAVEPFPLNVANLRANIELNQVSNVTILEKAITKDRRNIGMGCTHVNTGGAIYLWGDGSKTIETITLDDLISQFPRVQFLKMDIEGYEFEVLPEFTLWDRIVDAGIEIHNKLEDLGGTIDEVKALIAFLEKQPIKGKLWTPPLHMFEVKKQDDTPSTQPST